MAEVRPWIGSHVSVALLETETELKLVNCSTKYAPPVGSDTQAVELEPWIWHQINLSFSRPVTRSEDVAEYAPTQVMADVFRNYGYDGVAYGSRLGSGTTMAMFDLSAARIVKCFLYTVKEVNLNFSDAEDEYALQGDEPVYVEKVAIDSSGLEEDEPTEES